MDLEELALFADISGGIAVIATLFYLVIEIRRNTVASQSSAQSTQIATVSDWNLSLVHKPYLSDLILKANEDYSSVTPSEQLKLQGYYVNMFNLWHAAYWNRKKGLLDENGFRVWNEGTPMILRAQLASIKAWESMSNMYDAGFQGYVQSIIDAQGQPTSASSVAWTSADAGHET